MANVNCNIQKENEDKQLTVGQPFHIQCHGDVPEFLPEKLELRLDEKDKYKLKILKVDQTQSGVLSLTVTSYKPGDHELKALQLVDETHSVVLGDLKFQVVSVIKQEPGQQQEPFGAIAPLKIFLPWWYFVILFLLLAVLIGFSFKKITQYRQRKKLIKELNDQGQAMSPFHQFNQGLRSLNKKLNNPKSVIDKDLIEEFDKVYRVYLGREFLIPTHVWSDSNVLSDLKKRHRRLFNKLGDKIKVMLIEISEAKKMISSPSFKSDNKRINHKDLKQLLEMMQKNVDEIYLFLVEQKKDRSK